jgi:hypothetical protein
MKNKESRLINRDFFSFTESGIYYTPDAEGRITEKTEPIPGLEFTLISPP